MCLLGKGGGGVSLQSSLGKDLKGNFPVIHKQRNKHRTEDMYTGRDGGEETGRKPGLILPVFWTDSFQKTSFLDRQTFPFLTFLG